ncbi:uncharacterized protein LOC122382290 isoform X1 [Amphibalanus amphitrite]|uniref:uncharacterized protein LOC122382290 isoform X1 n=1 Tax=Amphibalanus amphitrite TaxID=1232801 RepID=UPI001C91838E|nr:uncharacterized protein LOC122382290 isoform X1 [Amphibalanus amphitrite]
MAATASPAPLTPCTPVSADRLSALDRGDRTLGVLTQKFVMLLLVSDRPYLSQDVLARVLLGQDGLSPDGQHKAKVRRLYDIANILQSVGLVGKDVSTGRRPVFTYTGPNVEPIDVDPATQRSRHSLIQGLTPLSSRIVPAPILAGRRGAGTPRSATATPRSGQTPAATPEGTPRGAGAGLCRPASLDDICRVTALERHRLFEQDVDASRGKSVLKRRLAEVQRAQAEVKRARPAPAAVQRQLSPAQHSQLSGLGIKRILIRAGDGTSQEICVREAAPAGRGDGPAPVGSRLEAALRGAWLTAGPAATPRPPRAPPAQNNKQMVVAYQLVPVVRTVTAATPENGPQTPLPLLYDEQTVLQLPEGAGLEPAGLVPTAVPTATPESLLTPGTMNLVREAVSSGTIKTVCNMSLTPEERPATAAGEAGRCRPAPRASRRLQMD